MCPVQDKTPFNLFPADDPLTALRVKPRRSLCVTDMASCLARSFPLLAIFIFMGPPTKVKGLPLPLIPGPKPGTPLWYLATFPPLSGRNPSPCSHPPHATILAHSLPKMPLPSSPNCRPTAPPNCHPTFPTYITTYHPFLHAITSKIVFPCIPQRP